MFTPLAFRRAAPKAVKHAKTSLGSKDPSFALQHAKFGTSRKRPGNLALDGVWSTLDKLWFNQGFHTHQNPENMYSKNTIATFATFLIFLVHISLLESPLPNPVVSFSASKCGSNALLKDFMDDGIVAFGI